MSHLRRAFFLTVAVAAVSNVLGCGEGSTSHPGPPSDPLEAARLTATGASSMGRVGVEGLPDPGSFSKIEVGDIEVVLTADGAESLRQVLDHDEDGWFFLTPLHPVDPLTEGTVLVHLTDGEARSGDQPLTIAPLPAAPGAYASMVDAVRTHLEQLTSVAGTSIVELKATEPNAVEPTLLPLKLAQSYLDDDTDPLDLTDVASNGSTLLDAAQLDFLDRVVSYLELESLVRLRIEALGEDLVELGSVSGTGKRGDCIDARIEIDTAQKLADRMTMSRVAEIGADPDSEAGRWLTVGSRAFAVLGSTRSPFALPAALAGTIFASVQAEMGFFAGIFPSEFLRLTCDIDRTEFNEDSVGFATYSNVEVVVASDAWSADKSLANILINGFGAVLSPTQRLRIADSTIYRDASLVGVGRGADHVFEETEIIQFCQQLWVINISESPFNTAADTEGHFSVDVANRQVRPAEVGYGNLVLAAQSTLFGGRMVQKEIPLIVHEIQVEVTPSDIIIDNPGDPVTLQTQILYADVETLEWAPDFGSWEDGLPNETNGGGTRTLDTPGARDAYPFDVTIKSTSMQGLRGEPGAAPRNATATVRLRGQGLIIEPAFACVRNGETQQFSTTGAQGEEVRWEIVGPGSIDANGVYLAPASGSVSVEVRASLAESPQVSAAATIDLAACDCYIKVEVTGDAQWSYEDSQFAYSVAELEGAPPFYLFDFRVPPEEGRNVGAHIFLGQGGVGPNPGDTGLLPAAFSYRDGGEFVYQVWFEDFTVDIERLTGSYMIGTFQGDLVHLDLNAEVDSRITVSAEFRARRYELLGGVWPCP